MNAEAANHLLARIIDNYNKKKVKNLLSKINILKMIALIYTEKLINASNNTNNPLHIMCYDLFLNKYGLKKIAENKYSQFLEACYFNLKIKKIYNFSRLINLIDPLEIDECNYYLSSFKFFDERLK